MKKVLLLAVILTFAIVLKGQGLFSYQAVVRNSSDQLVVNQTIGMQISIVQYQADGSSVYTETQSPETNDNGLISVAIGGGNVISGDISAIDWSDGPYFVKTEIDPAGGDSYTITGVTQLLSVPYAMHAQTVEMIDISGDENAFVNWDKNAADDFSGDFNDLENLPFIPENISDLTNDAGYLTEFTEQDADPANEIQDLQLSGNTLSITGNATASQLDMSVYLDNTDTQLTESEVDAMVANNGYLEEEQDADPANEIQDLQLSGNTLSITGNATASQLDMSVYLDNTDTQLTESEVDSMVANNGYLEEEQDADPANEIQDLQLSGNTLSITGNATASQLDMSVYLDNTDTQLTESEVDAMVANNGYLELPSDAVSGDMCYYNGSEWVKISTPGTNGAVLTFKSGKPMWSSDEVTEEIQVGDYLFGGIVVYLFNPTDPGYIAGEQHGLVISLANIGGYTQWGALDTDIPGSDGEGIGTGVQNTIDVVDYGLTGVPAELCYNYTGGGFSDWFLPSKDEFATVGYNHSIINTALVNNGGTQLPPIAGHQQRFPLLQFSIIVQQWRR